MRSDVETTTDPASTRASRRQGLRVVARSLLVSLAMVTCYFLLPIAKPLAMDTILQLTVGLGLLATLLAWQIMGILRSAYPTLQAVAALTLTVPLFLLVFASTYYVMSDNHPGNFSEPLTKLDSIYYAVTTFATVGFGDIAASSQPARAVVTVQMVGGLVMVGLIARVVVAAVEEAKRRRRAGGSAG